MNLGIHGFTYQDLYRIDRLQHLDQEFHRFVHERDADLESRFATYGKLVVGGSDHGGLTEPEESELLIATSRLLSLFLCRLFHVETEAEQLRLRTARDAQVAKFKKEFVAKRVAKFLVTAIDRNKLPQLDAIGELILGAMSGSTQGSDRELAVAIAANRLLDLERDYPRSAVATGKLAPSTETRAALIQFLERIRSTPESEELLGENIMATRNLRPEVASPESHLREAGALHELIDLMIEWLASRRTAPSVKWNVHEWTSFRLPHPLHFDRLVGLRPLENAPYGAVVGLDATLRRRDGFGLTDPRFTPREISDESHYCIYCQERKKDSCARGFVEKDETFRLNPLGVPLEGCPLDEKIGEMNLLRAEGDSIASLSIVMIDNPMCPGTGHRICNDCMRSCIFQKQEPVNIPQIETGVLTDVLFLPYGFEIYSLLTRWNPLNARRPVSAPYNGKNVLIVGLGPAGYTLGHYLAHEGFGIVGIDGLKIEPLPVELIGSDQQAPVPIADIRELWDCLDDRVLAGFGGVSEYGITVRWDKNFLKCVRIALERRSNVRFYGGVRFGGTLTIEDAFDALGFDHIAIAAGAGTPTVVRMKNNLVRGIRKASDFLMALQLTGAFKKNSMANLQVRLPALVIGGGLTAIDTATELFAYYPIQVAKTLDRYDTLVGELGADAIRSGYDAEELKILDEFLAHGAEIRAERARAATAGEAPNFIPLIRRWGGVTIAYRKGLNDSPAYRLNYEEVAKAMEEGISYAEKLSPIEALTDEHEHLRAMVFEKQVVEDGRWVDSGEVFELPARAVMVAAGTSPNVIYEKEHPGTFQLDKYGQFFQSHRAVSNGSESIELMPVETLLPNEPAGFFTSYRHPKNPRKLISFYGDNHPVFAGNVVKAMASAKHGYRFVRELFPSEDAAPAESWTQLVARLDDGLVARVTAVNRLTPTIVEVIVRAPFAAERFHPGQFYRLQNYETIADEIDGTKLLMEGIALTGAWTDVPNGLLSLIILEMGGSSRLCANLKIGEPVVVMGPTGTPTDIPANETVILAGGGLGNAVLFSIAKALKDNGCKIVYFAGYKKPEDVFKRDEIEAGTDQVVWSVDRGAPILSRRPNDFSFVGNIVQSMLAYATGEIRLTPENQRNGSTPTPIVKFGDVERLIAIGSDGMMRAVRDARHGVLSPHLPASHIGIGSINSPMQCMMKQVCAQCLQRHVDPKTGKESFIFSCFNQDQLLDVVDFDNLRARLKQNTVMEKLTNLWLTRLLAKQASG